MTYHVSPTLTNWQQQIIFGTVLGGSSIIKPPKCKNCYLSMRDKNEKWIRCKSQELSVISAPTPYHRTGNYLRWHSICSPVFNVFYDLFYDGNGKRKVEMKVLDSLRDIGLAVWFIDAGRLQDNCVIINVNNLESEGAELVAQYFKEIDLNSSIIKVRKSLRVKLDDLSSKQFIALIGHCIPNFIMR